MKYIFTSILLAGALTLQTGWAQEETPVIYPNVQHIEQTGESSAFDGFRLRQSGWNNLVKRTPVGDKLNNTKKALNLDIRLKKSLKTDQDPKNIAKAEGAYELEVDRKKAAIRAKDSIGVFYALQTLNQLIKEGEIASIKIADFPTVAYRGVVEGFYGTPWSTKDRISQLKFYGQVKANTYIYGPKDDPYHSSPDWRKPYPKDQADHIKELVGIANRNFVDFVWAIHPGQDIKWNDEDRQNVLKKFEHMYDLGVRSFALFFDDISGEGTNASKQAGLLNFLTKEFVEAKKDVKPLILTPTEYNKSWAHTGPDSYLNVLGRELDPSVQIMWTGDKVVADIDKSTLKWVQERIQRPALIWWNFPVSDYVRNHLLLGPSYGLEKDVDATEMSGILSNPMEHAEASKPAIFGVADYAWNTTTYDSDASWEKGIKTLLPGSYPAYQLFAENNSDPDKNWHGYRRDESVNVAPKIERLHKQIDSNEIDIDLFNQIKSYFLSINVAGKQIKNANDNPALIEEITPWLDKFTLLGAEGLAQMENYQALKFSSEALWNIFHTNISKTEAVSLSKLKNEPNIIPVSSTIVLNPFVEFLKENNNKNLIQKITGQEDFSTTNPGIGSITSDIPEINEAKLLAGPDQQIMIQPVLEVFEIKPSKSFTIELSQAQTKSNLKATFETDSRKWMKIELSEDGKNWFAPDKIEDEEKKIHAEISRRFKFIKGTNSTDKSVHLRLNQFVIENKDENAENHAIFTRDLDVFTSFELKKETPLVEKSSMNQPSSVILLTDASDTDLRIEIQDNKNNWNPLPGSFKGNYIEAELPHDTQAVRITSENNIKIYEILWR